MIWVTPVPTIWEWVAAAIMGRGSSNQLAERPEPIDLQHSCGDPLVRSRDGREEPVLYAPPSHLRQLKPMETPNTLILDLGGRH